MEDSGYVNIRSVICNLPLSSEQLVPGQRICIYYLESFLELEVSFQGYTDFRIPFNKEQLQELLDLFEMQVARADSKRQKAYLTLLPSEHGLELYGDNEDESDYATLWLTEGESATLAAALKRWAVNAN